MAEVIQLTEVLPDYFCGIFSATYSNEKGLFYATFHPEFKEKENSIVPTGRYIVLLLHPLRGTQLIALKLENDMWVDDALFETPFDFIYVETEPEFYDWCNKIINDKTM